MGVWIGTRGVLNFPMLKWHQKPDVIRQEKSLTDAQLYLAIGMPSIVALIGILVNIGYFVALNGRMTALETRMATVAEQTAVHRTMLDIVLKKLDELEARAHRSS
jgi:hypothetical protein